MEMLSDNKNILLRNMLALSLSDLKADEAVPLLMKLIKEPENVNRRGTLVYALQNLHCREYFADFVTMICTGNYEVSCHAYELFEALADDVRYDEKLDAKKMLEAQQQIELLAPSSINPAYSRLWFIEDALDILD
jgi:HEAT repeat protein